MLSENSYDNIRILFIQPSQIMPDGSIWKSKTPWLPRMALPQLAALTPEAISTVILDEYFEDIDFNIDVDIVALTATTVQAPRAYHISTEFQKRGIKTVIGGIHVSSLPDEAEKYVDSVIIGEAEGIWADVLNDLKNGNLKPKYMSKGKLDITNIPSPLLSKLSLDKYKVGFKPVQTTRGCSHDCGYCSVTKFFGENI